MRWTDEQYGEWKNRRFPTTLPTAVPKEVTVELEVRSQQLTMNKLRGRHWSRASSVKKSVKKEIGYQLLPILRNGPYAHCAISMHRIGWNKVDPTAMYELLKPILDSLVDLKVIPDDREEQVTLGKMSQEIDRSRKGQVLKVKMVLTKRK